MKTNPETIKKELIRIIESPLGFTIFYGVIAFIVTMFALIFTLLLVFYSN